MVDGPNARGEFLRARRALVPPGQAGIGVSGVRRVPGLRHDVGGRRGALMRFDHPVAGELVLNREKLIVAEAQNLTVAIYHADPGASR